MRTNAISHKVSDDLYLVEQTVSSGGARIAATPPPTHHVVVVDCSGSMSWDLPKIREQLKKKLPKLLAEKDVISVIWFSGRDQYGVLIEAEPVATLADLSVVNGMIDRWLRPVCLTGFLQPIQEVPKLVERCRKKYPSHAASLFFMSDGHDNCSVRSDVLKAVASAAGGLSAATFVEYGYYADRPLLAAMAEKASGALIFSEDFDRYAPQFEAAMQKKLTGGKKVEVPVSGDVVGGFAFAMQDGDLLTFAVEAGKIQVPEGISDISYLSTSSVGLAQSTLAEIAILKG